MSRRERSRRSLAAAAFLASSLWSLAAFAEEGWNPFGGLDVAAKPIKRTTALPPMSSPSPLPPRPGDLNGGAPTSGPDVRPPYAQPEPSASAGLPRQAANAAAVEHFALAPAPVADGGGLTMDAWRGMDVKAVEEAIATLSLPPRSAVLHRLWVRVLTAQVDPPTGGGTPAHFDAIRLEALYRSGLIDAMGQRLDGTAHGNLIMDAFAIRRDLALGRRVEACQTAKAQLLGARSLPIGLVSEQRLLAGYCAAVAGDMGGAGLAADLARDEGVDAPLALAALDALAGNGKGGLSTPAQVRLLDYRLLELLGPVDAAQIVDKAEPVLVAALALQDTAEPRARVLAGEAAARLHAITAEQLAAIYRSAPAGSNDPALRRAELVGAIAAEPEPGSKVHLMRGALDDARKAGLLQPMAAVLAPMLPADLVARASAVPGDTETAIEILLLTDATSRARALTNAASAWHWLPLIDIAEAGPSEAQREHELGSLEPLLRAGRLPSALLNRLATVLDATDVNVPIPLWEAASRTPQPASGYLPETGVLSQLQAAAKQKDQARTILLALRALGPTAADEVNIITLGDTIRALRRVGLDADARHLGVEALIAQWPHGSAS